MDIIVPTCGRDERLLMMLASLLPQLPSESGRIILFANNGYKPESYWTIRMLLQTLKYHGWHAEIHETTSTWISQIKYEALQLASSHHALLVDEDVLFIIPGTLQRLVRAVKIYSADAASPVGFEVDNEHPMLNDCAELYKLTKPNVDSCAEGRTAVGCCVLFTAVGRDLALHYWRCDFPYMEDQIAIHFIKSFSNYVLCHDAPVIHMGRSIDRAYSFNEQEVISFLEAVSKENPEYKPLLTLRQASQDGANFSKPLKFRA